MALYLRDLDERTRTMMLMELDYDHEQGALYLSNRLSDAGRARYPEMLRDAIRDGDDGTLAAALAHPETFVTHEVAHRKGKPYQKRVRRDANRLLAEGEFNRFYLRGLCRRAMEDEIESLVIYRAKEVAEPRPESEAKIGSRIEARSLLQDLRERIGMDTLLGLPPGAGSGLSAHLP
jgi:hypothetical protein